MNLCQIFSQYAMDLVERDPMGGSVPGKFVGIVNQDPSDFNP